ncbi:hypothetical protein PUNSTDRAFT_138501 [Punctularia strigosozonata HHB-11173 SS5]|uniref:Uncharacterized protein n=1 Tax=Punctularia strigosozonata (strain HHB-11173) TaxID=741275 RepID=R7S223_PUNST|nr:uncharacterized protein PUNSTDRAFT_138501 [Punctularia strigosozonata HHB-11173 SS5]EIN04460.1 hypothetical protein PUNSTDRAFT_138501 [Punctularia strigosozonata HHB-11173 SS5]
MSRQLEQLTQRVEALEAALGFQNTEPAPGVQWVPDADGNLATLPAPLGPTSSGGGEDLGIEIANEHDVARPWAHVGDPRCHLTREEIGKIMKGCIVPPTGTIFYDQLTESAKCKYTWFHVFLAKHYVSLIKGLGMHTTKNQKAFANGWKDPDWFQQAVFIDKRKRAQLREKSEKAKRPTDPPLSNADTWAQFLRQNAYRHPHGIKFEGDTPNELQLRRWLILCQIGPA